MTLLDIGETASTIKLSSLTAGDGKLTQYVTATADSAIITSTTAIFATDDVGKRIKVAGAGADGGDLFTTVASVQSATQVTLATSAATSTNTRGAILGTDCGPALQTALDTVFALRGGTILIDALFYWETPVLCDFGTTDGISLTLKGAGWSTGLLVAGDASKDMLTLQNNPRLLISEVNFAGTPLGQNDCRKLLRLESCEYILERSGFFGLSVIGPAEAGIVYARRCRTRHFDNEFGGCAASSGAVTHVVDIDGFALIDIARDRFIDYSRFQGAYLSKTPLGFCFSWIKVGSPDQATASVNAGSVLRVRDCQFDEGHFQAVRIAPRPDSGIRIPQAHFSGNRVNNTLLTGGNAFYFAAIDQLIIEQTSIGWANTPHFGMVIANCGDVMIDGAYITDGAPVSPFTGKADGLSVTNVRSLILKNATAFRRRVFESVGNVQEIVNGIGGVAPFSKRGRVEDADFVALTGVAPPAGTIAYDEGNKKLYVKDRDLGWLATPALTASTDKVFFLNNGTPTRGTLTGADTYEKTSGPLAFDTTANLTSIFTGGFRIALTIIAGDDVAFGPQDPSGAPLNNSNDYIVRVLRGRGLLYWGVPGENDPGQTLGWGSFSYTLGDLIELIYDPSAAASQQMIVKTAGNVRATHTAPAGLTPTTRHRFSSSLANVGAKFQLVDYAPL
ncbi:hypothetical protein [Sphingomonas sp. Mn802worker]|uniref:hypothetical protein n=1 Tax=Sphingomonas sp. Mn802worker TaxID=629773 RepID=UPI000366DC0B|nr:hypothetical protein [Sphingomonas sp. Mn802worker]